MAAVKQNQEATAVCGTNDTKHQLNVADLELGYKNPRQPGWSHSGDPRGPGAYYWEEASLLLAIPQLENLQEMDLRM